MLGLAAFAVPAGLIVALQWWPRTPMGRRILLPLPKGDDVLPDSDKRRNLKALVGKIGKARLECFLVARSYLRRGV